MAKVSKTKVTLSLRSDLHRRLRTLAGSIPGMTMSLVVDELLEDFLPNMEQLLEIVKEDDTAAQGEMLQRILADQVFSLAGEGRDAIRMFAAKLLEEEVTE